jgi:hypothetical protein
MSNRQSRMAPGVGFVVLIFSAVFFVFQAWVQLWPQPSGWVGATAVTVVMPFFALYWANHWRKQKEWFFGSSGKDT